jgi:hypothetical protein
MTTHLPTCRIRTEHHAGEPVTYSEPDPECQHESHQQ